MRRRNIIINAGLAVAVVVVAVVAYATTGDSTTKAAARTSTTTVTQGDITSTVSASGNVVSAVNVGVSFNGCSGVLTSVSVAPGQKVTAGQTLATADTTAAQATLTAANAQLTSAQDSLDSSISAAKASVSNAQSSMNLDLAQAQQNVDTAQDAYNAKPSSQTSSALTQAQNSYASSKLKDQQQVTSAESQLTQAESSGANGASAVSSAQTTVSNAQKALGDCTLTSPIAATVVTVNGTVGSSPGSGAVASAGSSSSSGTGTSASGSSNSGASNSGAGSSTTTSGPSVSSSSGFITLSDLTQMVIPSSVSEADIGSVKTGQPASVVFAALTDANDPNGTTVQGTVSQVSLTSTVSNSVVSYGVTIALTAPPANLRLGQSGTATITTASKTGVLRLSSSAITTTGLGKTVEVRQGTTTKIVTITTGLTGNGETEIDSGLTAGEVVLVPTTSTTSTSTLLRGGAGAGGAGGLLGGTR